jgi:hypothetical protein
VATVVAEVATVAVVVVFTEEVLVVGSTGEASAVALSTAVVVSVGDVSEMAVSTAVAFVVAVLVGATSAITDSPMMSSSAASAFRGRGAIRTDITVTTITRTITMDTAGTRTATTMDTADTVTTVAPVMDIAMATERVMDTAMAADQGIPGVRGVGDKPGYGSLKSPPVSACR